jgi:hypothetical protein
MLRALEEESKYLPPSVYNATLESGLIDYLASGLVSANVNTIKDCSDYVDSNLWKIVKKTSSLVASGLRDRVILQLEIFRQGDLIKIERLSNQLRKIDLREQKQNANIVLSLIHCDGKLTVTARVPDFDQTNNGQVDNLGHLLRFAIALLGVLPENLRIVNDPSLGRDILLPAKLIQMISSINQSSRSSKGSFAGDVYKYKSGLKANLVETLGAIRLLRTHVAQVRKRPAMKKRDGTSVSFPVTTLEDLKSQFNIASGLTDPGVPAFTKSFVTAVLAECVKETNKAFPGGFIYALKERNGVKNSEGVLNLMGHISKVPSTFKIKQIFMTTVTEESKAIRSMDFEKDSPDEMSYGEFRAAACLTLPFIDPKSSKAFKDQIAESPYTTRSKELLDHFNEVTEKVDSVNLCHAVLTAVKSAKNKTASPKHFRVAKETLVAKFKQPVFKDRSGTTYPAFKDLPSHVKTFLAKLYHKDVIGQKRDGITSIDAELGDVAMSDDTPTPGGSSASKKKLRTEG